MPLEPQPCDEQLLDLRSATRRVAEGMTDLTMRLRVDKIADELLALARADARIWLGLEAEHHERRRR